MVKKVIFICTGNSCRSQMAEGWARSLFSSLKKDGRAYSAGISPAGLNPLSVKVMSEVGIDISAPVSYTHLPSPRDLSTSRMPSSA